MTLKFVDVTLVRGSCTWINFSEIECIQSCLCRLDDDTGEITEDEGHNFF